LTVKMLSDIVGLPLGLDESGSLVFEEGLPPVKPQVRTLEEMRVVLYNQTAIEPGELYYMYRNVGRPEDIERCWAQSLRFDVTVLVPGLVGGELVKTAGHYHPEVGAGDGKDGLAGAAGGRTGDAAGLTYPELYQVVSGRAHYLLQKPAPGDGGSLADVVIVDCGPGDALYVPPGYGHVTINPGSEHLVMVNVVDGSFSSVYGPYRERHGAAYYEIQEHEESYFIANDHYPDPPEPRLARPTGLDALGLRPGVPLYRQLAEDPGAFSFLSHPPGDGPRL